MMQTESSPPSIRLTPAAVLVALVNCAVFFWAESQGNTQEISTLLQFGASSRTLIWEGQWWRFITPMFLHIGWVHFLWNTAVMFRPDTVVEQTFGTMKFLLAYFFTGIGATAVSLLCHNVIAAGASGAGFGIYGVLMVLSYRRLRGWKPFLQAKETQQNAFILCLWFFAGFSGAANMDNYAHLGGLIFGLLLGWLYTTNLSKARPRYYTAAWVCSVLLLAGSVAAAAYPWPDRAQEWKAYRLAVSAMEAAARGEHQQAVELLNDAESFGYTSWDLFYNRSLSRTALGDVEGGLKDAETVVLAIRSQPEGYLLRADCLHRLGKSAAAAADYRQALKLAPKNWPQEQEVRQALEDLEPKEKE